ncbi:hypothetical protein F8388_027287 [Cannabis sativa]|uniref:Uncharacterized protein n=1 Tax=Cannabis sativa TaxID=3483 RepID=A0A7J6FPH6_CANSA|nr:hypothetical protein F8388_027287 [Cannabis sativa]KAF4399513.1 hypothetical protein G4B88_022596 [Cannabis sativa]
MKKLYRKGTVHPSPPIISDHLSFLPAAILTLTVALTPEDREILAYLISCSNGALNFSSAPSQRSSRAASQHKNTVFTSSTSGKDHPPQFNCDCFRCYTSYWVRWGSSPNRQLIHEIIDAFEDQLLTQNKGGKTSKKERRNKRGSNNSTTTPTRGSVRGSGTELNGSELSSRSSKEDLCLSESVQGLCSRRDDHGHSQSHVEGDENDEDESMASEKGSVRRFVNFIGERIWGVWG